MLRFIGIGILIGMALEAAVVIGVAAWVWKQLGKEAEFETNANRGTIRR